MYERCIVRDRRQHTELRRAERRAGGQDDGAFANVLAAAPDVLLRVAPIADRDVPHPPGPLSVPERGSFIRILLADHRVRALRQWRAGEDAGRLRLAYGLPRKLPGCDRLDDVEVGLGLLEIGTPDRIAIHRGIVPGW